MGAGQLFFMLRIYRICCKCSRVNNRVALANIQHNNKLSTGEEGGARAPSAPS